MNADFEYSPLTELNEEVLHLFGFNKFVYKYRDSDLKDCETVFYLKSGLSHESGYSDAWCKYIDLENKKFVFASSPYDYVDCDCAYLGQLRNVYYVLTGKYLDNDR